MNDPMPENEFLQTRGVFRTIGPLLLGVGLILIIIGVVDFFSSVGSFSMPRLFWTVFLGLPLLGIGFAMTKAGYAGKIARYYGREVGPAVSETFNEIARDSREGIGVVAEAIREAPGGVDAERLCPECGYANDHDAKFCAGCGRAFPASITCPACGEPVATGARFCDECGRRMAT